MKRNVHTIREELCAYIQSADGRKVTALYDLPEEQIAPRHTWWQDANVVNGLEERYKKMEEGIDKGVSSKTLLNNFATKKAKMYAGK